MKKVYAENVEAFIVECEREIGKWAAEKFESDIFYEITKCRSPIHSPIEQILYCALKFIAQINFIKEPDCIMNNLGDKWEHKILGLHIHSQREINKYRVDFLLEYGYQMSTPETYKMKSLIVECDSQEFHERTEKERRYEKARDRHLVSMGYKVFHYTGSEICRDPIGVAVEILVYLTEDNKEYFVINSDYDNPA